MRYNWKWLSKKARTREEIQNKSIEMAESLPKHNGLAYLTLNSPEFATHWVARVDGNGIRKDTFYRIYLDQYEGKHVILNNDGEAVVLDKHLAGESVILQGSDQWWFHVDEVWRKEWQQTEEYKEMMRQSMEAIREDEER